VTARFRGGACGDTMIQGHDIICISSIDWDFIWQGHQEIMSTLAANGNRILFIENTGVRTPSFRDMPRLKKRVFNWLRSVKGIRKERDNLYIYSPLILPLPYSRIARWINKHLLVVTIQRWMKSIGFSNPIIWTFLPTGIVLDVIHSIDHKLVIYYCIDNFSASSPEAKKVKETEVLLLKRANLVFVTSKNLYDACRAYNENVHIFSYGVNMDVYDAVKGQHIEPPKDMEAIRHPIVGYVGGVHKWIDFDLLKFTAAAHRDKSFVFVGPLQRSIDELKSIPNIHFLGQKRYAELPSYVISFDACIIPYLITEYTKNVYPTKLNEYLSLGKPVISTALPEVEAFNGRNSNIIVIAPTKESFASAVGGAVKEPVTGDLYKKRVEVAVREGSWKLKIEKMSGLLEKGIADIESEKSLRWKDSLLRSYRTAGKRLIGATAIIVSVYLILFNTPFIWIVGKPLKVSSPIDTADAVVVFAGGVGESGKAGQGYEERVQYAVELYKAGYAGNIIFSSGYTYAIKEAEIMKALAVSLGIPPEAIMLEDRAANTYENVKYSGAMLKEKGMRKAIIVSSPYNMRRISMVSKKAAPEIKFIYMPIPRSLFFGDEKTVQVRHIIAIMHEYIGIGYYWFKGYI